MRTTIIAFLFAVAPALAGCAVFGDDGPKQHTVIDYKSLDPDEADSGVGEYRYGHSGVNHSGTGVETDEEN